MAVLSTLTGSLERCWTAIRTVHPDTRQAAMVVYLHPRGDRRGHYSPDCWTTRQANKLDEVHISSHILQEGAVSVFRTLLHEACHSMAHTRGIQDTSRQGRYHNAEFHKLAKEVGLLCGRDARIGVVTTDVGRLAQAKFRNALAELDGALELWQDARIDISPPTGRGKNNSIKLVCPTCRRILRASTKTIEAGPIMCVPCAVEFVIS